jgi:glycosyltransferase involved in cell wall biosynthesis
MKKVLHLITGLEKGGGAEAMLLKTVPFLKNTENAVCVFKDRGEIGRELERKGVKVYYLDMKGYWDLGAIKRYKKAVKDFRPDIQVNYLIHADIFGRIFGKRYGIKKVVSYIRNRHSNFIYSFPDKFTLKRVDFLLTNSRANLRFYRDKYNFPQNKSTCIPNGVEVKDRPAEEKLKNLKNELGLTNEFVITCVARLHKQKNIDTLIRAGQILARENDNFKILLIGDGKERENLEKLARKLNITDKVEFPGKRDDVWEILNISHLFVLPSSKEGMSNALLEAMAAGLPAVVSDIEENKELVDSGKNGYTFKVRDENDLAEKIKRLQEDDKKRAFMGEASKKKVKENYDINKVINTLDKFLYNI